MKKIIATLAALMSIAAPAISFATGTTPPPQDLSINASAGANAEATGGNPTAYGGQATANPVVNNHVAPQQNMNVQANPTANAGAKAVGVGQGGNATSNAYGGEGGKAIANPTAHGGNATAYGGEGGKGGQGGSATGGNASLHGTVSGTNTSTNNNALKNTNTSTVSNANTNANSVSNTLKQGDVNSSVSSTNVLKQGDVTNTNTVTTKGGEGGSAKQDQRQDQSQGQGQSQSATVRDSGNAEQGQSQSTKVQNSGNAAQSQSVQGSGNSKQEQQNKNDLNNVGSPVITFQAAKPALPAAPIPQHFLQPPTLFGQRGQPANAQAIDFALNYLSQCPPNFGNADVREVREKGSSRYTRVIYTPHSNYLEYARRDIRPRARVAMIPEQVEQGKCVCLGLLQVEAFASDASEVAIQSVINDAGLFVRDELRGFEEVRLILIPAHSISVNMGIRSHGNGIGAAPGLSGMLSSILGTLGFNASLNNGRTFPEAQVGATFALVAAGEVPDGAPALDISSFHNALRK